MGQVYVEAAGLDDPDLASAPVAAALRDRVYSGLLEEKGSGPAELYDLAKVVMFKLILAAGLASHTGASTDPVELVRDSRVIRLARLVGFGHLVSGLEGEVI